jgi:flagellar hook-length control protein FliK
MELGAMRRGTCFHRTLWSNCHGRAVHRLARGLLIITGMNATIPNFKAPVAPHVNAAAPSESAPAGASPADSGKAAAGTSDFAGTLHQVVGKPGRKPDSAKAGSGGASLPPAGSPSPPPASAAAPIAPAVAPSTALPANPPVSGSAAGTAIAAPAASGAAPQGPPAGEILLLTASAAGGLPADSSPGASSAAPTANASATSLSDAAGITSPSALQVAGADEAAPDGIDLHGTPAVPTAANLSAEAAANLAAAQSHSPDAADPALAAKAAAAARAARTSGASGDASGADGSSAPPPQSAVSSPQSDAAVNLALIEGSDATGATATALESTQAATAGPVSLIQLAPTQNLTPPDPTQGAASTSTALAVLSIAGGANDRDRGAAGGSGGFGGSGGSTAADGAAALQQLTANAASTSNDTAPVSTLRVHTPVDSAEFPQAVADRVSFMVDNSWSNAKLSVNPPQLGPIELQIAVQGDHAQVMMSTHSALTRDALESSVPKLREMLSSQGFTQVNVDVSQRSFQERSPHTAPYAWTPPVSSSAAAAASAAGAAAPRTILGLVDAYA